MRVWQRPFVRLHKSNAGLEFHEENTKRKIDGQEMDGMSQCTRLHVSNRCPVPTSNTLLETE
jgi:hypothetical protein